MINRISQVIVVASFFPGVTEAAGKVDTASHSLREVVVAVRQSGRDEIPVKTLSGEELERLDSNGVADALRYYYRIGLTVEI